MIACLLQSLEYLHAVGVVHRDIKPENMVFDERGYIKLTDFGISRFYQSTSNSSVSTGDNNTDQ